MISKKQKQQNLNLHNINNHEINNFAAGALPWGTGALGVPLAVAGGAAALAGAGSYLATKSSLDQIGDDGYIDGSAMRVTPDWSGQQGYSQRYLHEGETISWDGQSAKLGLEESWGGGARSSIHEQLYDNRLLRLENHTVMVAHNVSIKEAGVVGNVRVELNGSLEPMLVYTTKEGEKFERVLPKGTFNRKELIEYAKEGMLAMSGNDIPELEINFLNDRDMSDSQVSPGGGNEPPDNNKPPKNNKNLGRVLGAIVLAGTALAGTVFGGWQYIEHANTKAELDAALSVLEDLEGKDLLAKELQLLNTYAYVKRLQLDGQITDSQFSHFSDLTPLYERIVSLRSEGQLTSDELDLLFNEFSDLMELSIRKLNTEFAINALSSGSSEPPVLIQQIPDIRKNILVNGEYPYKDIVNMYSSNDSIQTANVNSLDQDLAVINEALSSEFENFNTEADSIQSSN